MIDKTAEKPSERIAKVMARAGLCSRRAAEEWILAGRVTVNGERITSPALNVTAKDRIAVDGQPLPVRERTRLFLYNKPRNLVTTHDDPQGRPTIFGALPGALPRLISVGRLDFTTEGLLLLTNDGGLARVLELPATGWLRRYRVRAHGKVTQPQLDALRKGIEVEGVRYGAIEARLERVQGANVWLTFAIREGKNREVRNVLSAIGLDVNRLIRVSYGPFQLGDLPEGGVEEVKTRTLREQLGERVISAAGADFSGPITVRNEDFLVASKPSDKNADGASSTSPLLRGEVGSRNDPGEGASASLRKRKKPLTPTLSPHARRGSRKGAAVPKRMGGPSSKRPNLPRDRSRKPRKR
jgi:23S rRNA pseudouridine2605 synthase